MDAYSSHLPVLSHYASLTGGSILELGCGDYSTSFLGDLSRTERRFVVSIETNLEWWKLCRKYATELHWIRLIPDASHWDAFCRKEWDVAFVDSAPAKTRAIALRKLLHVRYVIVHDTEPEQAPNYPGMHAALALFQSRRDYHVPGMPTTTVVSNVCALLPDGAVGLSGAEL